MERAATFAQILEEKLRSKSTEEFTPSRPTPSYEAVLLNQLLTSTPRHAFQNTRHSYPKPQPKPRQAHALSSDQSQALSLFQGYLPDFSPGFFRHELKSAYRQLALRLHPDHGGSTQKFMQLRQAYKTLELVFANTSPQV